ncbi:MAG TPA: hypothetical protein VGM54_05545 [Chthoniobacter sp.]|jgi:lysozyme family protein
MSDIAKLITANTKRWSAVQVKPDYQALFQSTAKRLVAADAKARYVAVSAKTKVPWFIIAVIHEREASQSWKGNLAQGDPWNKVSIHVPKGRGPFKSWEDAAYDALVNCPPKAASWTNWKPGGALTLLEEYNGLGYAAKGRPSPYVWAGSNQYSKGKYVSDGHYDPNAIDHQLGCAPLLQTMMTLDATIKFS